MELPAHRCSGQRPGEALGDLGRECWLREGTIDHLVLVPRWGLLEQLVPVAQSFKKAHGAFLALLTPGKRLLTQLGQGQLGPEG